MSARETAVHAGRARLAYLFSRWPVLSQTFVDNEMLALEAAGWELTVAAVNPPVQDLRHARLDALRAPVLHNPPSAVRRIMEARWRDEGRWPAAIVDDYAARFGGGDESARRCRNALYFADMLPRLGITHVHGHFANQATYSALFLKALSGIGFSLTPQAQDFMVDLRSPELLSEMATQAAFLIAPCDDAQRELEARCPESAGKTVRIYNGIDPAGSGSSAWDGSSSSRDSTICWPPSRWPAAPEWMSGSISWETVHGGNGWNSNAESLGCRIACGFTAVSSSRK
jgi:hypothetical protein